MENASKTIDVTIVQVIWDKHSIMFDYDKEINLCALDRRVI
jgi:hypothetical protein